MALTKWFVAMAVLIGTATAVYAPPNPEPPTDPAVLATALSADGKYFVAGFPKTYPDRTWTKVVVPPVTVWDTTTGKEIQTFAGHDGKPVWFVAFTPDGKNVISGGDDNAYRMWSIKTGKEVWKYAVKDEALITAALSPDGKILAVFEDLTQNDPQPQLKLLDAVTGECRKTFDVPHVTPRVQLQWSPRNDFLFADFQLINIKQGKIVRSFQGDKETNWGGVTTFSPDGKYLLIQKYENDAKGQRQSIVLWDFADEKELKQLCKQLREPNGPPLPGYTYVRFDPTGKYLLLSEWTYATFRFWSIEKDKEIWVLPFRPRIVTINPTFLDGNILMFGAVSWPNEEHVLCFDYVDLNEKRAVRETKFFLK
jgi:WD40 repeat protein